MNSVSLGARAASWCEIGFSHHGHEIPYPTPLFGETATQKCREGGKKEGQGDVKSGNCPSLDRPGEFTVRSGYSSLGA